MSRLYWFAGMVFVLVSAGCSIYTGKVEMGKILDEASIKKIVDGHTTGSEIMVLFGAPTKTSRLGKEELFVYKHCTTDSSSITVTAIGHTGSQEKCDELSIVLDENGVVKSHGFVAAAR